MKLSQFKSMLRELISEEVTKAVKRELRILTEQKVVNTKASTKTKTYAPQRNTPLVTLDEPFRSVGGPLGDLLQETANSMAGFGEEVEEANPDFPIGSAGTDAFVKDYSEVLKKSQNLR